MVPYIPPVPSTTPSATLALVATVHVALLVLLHHQKKLRGGERLFLVPPALLAFSPWLLSNPPGLVGGLAVHVAWYTWLRKQLPGSRTLRLEIPKKKPVPGLEPLDETAAKVPVAPASAGFLEVPVLAVFDENREIRTFRLARPQGFVFVPGQFLMVRLAVEGKSQVRCYSISSSPESRGYLEISVRRQGLVSRTLHATVVPGTLLSIQGAAGHFVYPAGDSRPLVLLAGGVGITPMISMLRHAVANEPTRPVVLLLSARGDAGVPFEDEMRCLSRRHPQTRIVVTLTGEARPGYHSGRIDRRLIETFVADPAHSIFCICGPGPMIEGLRSTLKAMGVPDSQVRFEAFEAAVASASVAGRPDPGVAPPRSVPRDGPTLRLSISERSVPLAPGQTLLEAAETGGAGIPSMCRAGVCGTCKTRLVAGQVDFDGGALDADELKRGFIYPCVAVAKTDCVLEA